MRKRNPASNLKKYFYPVAGILFLLSYLFNIFGVGYINGWFNDFEEYSERFVLSSVQCSIEGEYKGGLTIPDEFLGAYQPKGLVENTEHCAPYASQFGLQGYTSVGLTRAISGIASNESILFGIKIIQVLLLIIVILLFVRFVQSRYGYLAASVLVGFLLISDWLVGFSRNLYWVPFLMFLPFVFVLYAYPRLQKTRKKYFYLIIGLLFLLKFLTGYEFFTVLALSACAPIVYYELIKRSKLKKIAIECMKVLAVSIAAFVLAMGIHIGSMFAHYGSLESTIGAVRERGEKRADPTVSFKSSVLNFEKTRPELYAELSKIKSLEPLKDGTSPAIYYVAIMFINYITLPVITIPVQLKGLLQTILGSFGLWVALACLGLVYIRKYLKNEYKPLLGVLVFSLVSSFSWLVAAPGHFFEHAHLNAIIYYLPLMLWVFTIVAIVCRDILRKLVGSRTL